MDNVYLMLFRGFSSSGEEITGGFCYGTDLAMMVEESVRAVKATVAPLVVVRMTFDVALSVTH